GAVGPVGEADGGDGLYLLPPEGDPVGLASLSVTDAESLSDPGSVLVGYGPTEAMGVEGLVLIAEPIDDAEFPVPFPDDDHVLVSADQDPLLAERGAVLGDRTLSWIEPADAENQRRVVNVWWYGSELTTEDVLAIAARLGADPDLVLGAQDLPDAWQLQVRLDDDAVLGDAIDATLAGALDGFLSSGGAPLPLGLFSLIGVDESSTVEEVSIRGTAGVLVVIDDQGGTVSRAIWREGGSTHQVIGFGPADEVLALVERLVPVDRDTIERRQAELANASAQATTSLPPITPTTMTTATPTTDGVSTTAPGPGDVGPEVSFTAPGPGAIDTVPTGSTTTSPPTTIPSSGSGPATSGPGVTPPETTIPVPRPEGSFTDNSNVPVGTDSFGQTPYEIGVSWSPRFGLCLGIDLDGDLIGGGYPVECEINPWIGFGGRREVPGVGTIVFAATADTPALAAADLAIGDQVTSASIERVDAFPGFAFLIIPLDGVAVEEVDQLSLPGAIVLYDGAGQPLGWG
ncbi:MAG: hypothetical protein AAFO29_19085, partial [Actinomycetota bacterium]